MSIRSDKPKLGWGITGFGLAHIVLGTFDLVDKSNRPGIQPTSQNSTHH